MSFMGFVLSVFALASALGVVSMRNPLYSAFWLVVHLFAIAGLYAVLEAHFLAVSQIVVYAGAIMVLVLFVLMLLNLKTEDGRGPGLPRSCVAVVAGGVAMMAALPPLVDCCRRLNPIELSDAFRRSEGSVAAIGTELYGKYAAQFELSSIVLLIGVVGAVMLSKRKNPTLGPRPGGIFAGGKQ